jgi:hypothetical protein
VKIYPLNRVSKLFIPWPLPRLLACATSPGFRGRPDRFNPAAQDLPAVRPNLPKTPPPSH